MTHPSPPIFGRRGLREPASVASRRVVPATYPIRSVPTLAAVPDTAAHADVFAVIRREIAPETSQARVVPRSLGAALMAGLVVGFCLAGLDVTRMDATLHRLADATGTDTARWLPMMILAALIGGARAAATSLLVAHTFLKALALTSHLAYAIAGGAVAAVFALGAIALVRAGIVDDAMMPGHGLGIDIAAGAAAGALYRMFAGARPV